MPDRSQDSGALPRSPLGTPQGGRPMSGPEEDYAALRSALGSALGLLEDVVSEGYWAPGVHGTAVMQLCSTILDNAAPSLNGDGNADGS